MLILTRRSTESIEIGGVKNGQHTLFTANGQPVVIKLCVLGIKGSQVRFGVDAPKGVPVHRDEVAERIRVEELGNMNGNVAPAHASA